MLPAGETAPPSDGLALVVSVNTWRKLAVTDLSPSMVTRQDPLPEQAPDQAEKMYPPALLATIKTWVPALWVVVPEGDTVPPTVGLALVVRR